MEKLVGVQENHLTGYFCGCGCEIVTEDIQIEIDYYGDELNAVFHKGDKVYIYPIQEVAHIVDRLAASGAMVIDNTVEGDYTVYYQGE